MPLDEQTVEEIYRDHAPALRRFAVGFTASRAQAEDVVQETILRTWQQAPKITTSMRSYLFRTARNVIIDNFRRQQRRPHQVHSADVEQVSVAVENVDRLLTKVLMEEALARLSVDHRNVIIALHYRRYTAVEAAVQLSVPVGTVKSRAFYALKALRSVLDEMGVEA
ncbi:sigma-70 family RNA polymerase sigma factor [Arthrobacter cryoconiti]|uniref:Sigma-70 family RNA polymerase sigma factor n=1 Tax=Arthrobacter cryoconiti TaxID=748907 RepID=A0ABV8QZ19_9MICC|nr:sigma-70 family RNA polymerase sigma factor [Arthrobacter cryoconiti]MCC9068194.1 sigma-70 family RNA polymerase sigma factor [Arthrobacter cryoconiti]